MSSIRITGVKRSRMDGMLVFPRDFEKRLLRCLARHGAYIRDHLEIVGEFGHLELPEELTRLWIEGMLLTADDLLATANSVLKEYLKVWASVLCHSLVASKLTNLCG